MAVHVYTEYRVECNAYTSAASAACNLHQGVSYLLAWNQSKMIIAIKLKW